MTRLNTSTRYFDVNETSKHGLSSYMSSNGGFAYLLRYSWGSRRLSCTRNVKPMSMNSNQALYGNGDAPADARLEDRMARLDINSGTNNGSAPSSTVSNFASDDIDAEKLATEMQRRCRQLLSELEQFQAHLKKQRREHTVELRTFRSGLQAEMRLIDKVLLIFLRKTAFANRVACSLSRKTPLQAKPRTPCAPQTSNSTPLCGQPRSHAILFQHYHANTTGTLHLKARI